MCRCVCGVEKTVFQTNLTRKLSTGCGCKARAKTGDRARTHGKRHTRLYVVWCGMRRRCYVESDISYPHYGGRGITVCDEWLGKDGFQNFWDWAYATGYDENAPSWECTIDRIDVNGNYEPSNCRWVNREVQSRNKTNTSYVQFGNERLPLVDYCAKYGVSPTLATDRFKRGWTPAEVMFFEPKDMSSHIEYNGEVHSQREWAKIFGVSKSSFQYRLSHGWTFEQAVGIEPPPNKHSPSWKDFE